MISGARQVGKTTLMLQAVQKLILEGIPPSNILYVTFDHPLFKGLTLDSLLRLWREFETAKPGAEYLFLDEIQMQPDWQIWLKHQVDFEKGRRRIAVTRSVLPLNIASQESGMGRWVTLTLPTLSFYEYMQLRKLPLLKPASLGSFSEGIEWTSAKWLKVAQEAKYLTGHFHEYILRGGFPQSALVESIPMAQKLLREDILDKVLKRDMTAFFGVRNILELEQVFLYLCLHEGGLLAIPEICKSLELKRPTVSHFIDLFESIHLIYRLLPFGYGKQVLRARAKVYLADPALAPSILLKGKSLLEDPAALGNAVEATFYKHLFNRYNNHNIKFGYWRNKKDQEVDIVAEMENEIIPFEVKYRSSGNTGAGELKGLTELLTEHQSQRGYVITRDWNDFGLVEGKEKGKGKTTSKVLKIPAPLACYWLGAMQGKAEALL